jgi:hypothetical protein
MDILHTSFFCIICINFNHFAPARNKTSMLLYQSEFCTHSHFFSDCVIIPKPFPTDGTFEGTKEVDILGSKIWAMWWMRKFYDCF